MTEGGEGAFGWGIRELTVGRGSFRADLNPTRGAARTARLPPVTARNLSSRFSPFPLPARRMPNNLFSRLVPVLRMGKRIAFLAAAFAALCLPAFAGEFDADIAGSLERRGFFLTLLIVYAGGVMVSLTPCVYPMIPITLGAIGARSAATRSTLHGLVRSLVFVLGIALVSTRFSATWPFEPGARSRSPSRTRGWCASSRCSSWQWVSACSDLFVIQMPAALAGRLQSGANRGGFLARSSWAR